ncbi:MAG: MBL fold metallo-hydrolase [Chloroflexi bacterium]|nr:MBL fold metallo-hydrolase [Chloroflexota bacterium]
MQAIAEDVYIENQYMGVTLGAIRLPHGLIQVDAPPSPEDVRSWRAALLNLGGSSDRLLVNLDAHPDRTLGARSMDCTVVAQEKATQVFRNRPSTFKTQGDETGADWETIPGLGNVRWAPPEISFSHAMTIHWGGTSVLLEHHPGPGVGASWVILPEPKVVFVGDTLVLNQPPFLASADLPAWIDALKLLLSPAYRGWLVVSGRGGLAPVEVIRAQVEYLKHILGKLDKLADRVGAALPEGHRDGVSSSKGAAQKKSPSEEIERLIAPLLSGFKIPNDLQRQYAQRLRYGLNQYYLRHYRPTNNAAE